MAPKVQGQAAQLRGAAARATQPRAVACGAHLLLAACCAAAAVCALVCVQHGAGGIRRTPPRLCPTQGARPTRTVANGPSYAGTASTQCAQGAKNNGPRGVAQRQPQPTATRALAQTKHTARELHAGPKPRIGHGSYPAMPPMLGCLRNTRGRSRRGPCPLFPPPFRSGPSAPRVPCPAAHLERHGAAGLKRAAPPTPRRPPAAPAPCTPSAGPP